MRSLCSNISRCKGIHFALKDHCTRLLVSKSSTVARARNFSSLDSGDLEHALTTFLNRGVAPKQSTSQIELRQQFRTISFMHSYLVERNVDASVLQAEAVLADITSSFSVDDHYLDLAGTLNDLSIMYLSLEDTDLAIKYQKRALHMVNRSYAVHTNLRTCLLSSLTYSHSMTGDHASAISYADRLAHDLTSSDQQQQSQQADTTSGTSFIQTVHPELRKADCYFTLAAALAASSKGADRFERALLQFENGFQTLAALQPLPSYFARELVHNALKRVVFVIDESHRVLGTNIVTGHLDKPGPPGQTDSSLARTLTLLGAYDAGDQEQSNPYTWSTDRLRVMATKVRSDSPVPDPKPATTTAGVPPLLSGLAIMSQK